MSTILRRLLTGAFVLLMAAACQKAAEPASPRHLRLHDGAEPLRQAFNADVGKVRVLMLLSPA